MGDKSLLNFGSKFQLIYNFTCEIIKLPWERFVSRWRSRFKDVMDEFLCFFVHFRLNFIWSSLLRPYNKLLVTIYSSKRVNTKTNTLMAAIGFEMHFTRAPFSVHSWRIVVNHILKIWQLTQLWNILLTARRISKGLYQKKFKIMLTY